MNNKYTEQHFNFIKENVKNTEKDLVKMFNEKFEIKITVGILGNIKSKLGIRSGLVGGRFEKGHNSFNKGKKWDEFMSVDGQTNSLKTTFKKGHQPHNHRTIGSERINKDGYVEIKIAEPNKWQLKHRYVYEQAFGIIPKGKKLIFLDGNRLNISLSNLQIISNEQSLIMNQKRYFSTNKDLTQTGIIVSKVISETRKLRRRS